MQLNISMNSNGPNEYSMPQYELIYIYICIDVICWIMNTVHKQIFVAK